jgi:cellulose synthase/poly-beta-1,6-N-acetylglucosamine synthase-like glycosyltransferase
MLIDVLVASTFAYGCVILIFALAAAAAVYNGNSLHRPFVSIIVAARNEERHIAACVESLLSLTYPRDILEIIIVDDRSTDRTREICERYASVNPHLNVISGISGSGHLQGKPNAVAQGIQASTGEVLLFTDADCIVPRGWVEGIASHYADPSVGVVAGFTSLRGENWFSRMQALDWFVLFSAAAATTRIGFPTTAVGTNLSVRREAYNRVGGYEKIPFSVTEDYALFHAVTSMGYRARIPMDRATLVESLPCATARQLFAQKKRWFTGGRGMDIRSLMVFSIPYVFNVFLILALFLLPGAVPWWALTVKVMVDFALTLPAVLRFRRLELLSVFPVFFFYYWAYVLIFPPLVLPGGKITWKDRSF